MTFFLKWLLLKPGIEPETALPTPVHSLFDVKKTITEFGSKNENVWVQVTELLYELDTMQIGKQKRKQIR